MSETESQASVRDEELFRLSGLPGTFLDWQRAGYRMQDDYPMRLTGHCLGLIRQAVDQDPIARQFVPRCEEDRGPGSDDPLEEGAARSAAGLVHQYTNRVLLMPTGTCAVNCRHCNRRWSRLQLPAFTETMVAGWVDYLNRTPDVTDVLITGGDPLTLSDDELRAILEGVSSVRHVRWIRIGTRVPSVLPERVTPALVELFRRHKPLYLQVQFNTLAECGAQSAQALATLRDAGISVQNQMVLLQGVNDTIASISALCHWLVEQQVRPYYLFVPERVKGTSHFWVSLKRAADLAARLRRMLSGLAMPLVVVDTPHGGGKVPLFNSQLRDAPGGVWVTDLWGRQVFFPEVGEAEAWGETTQEELG